MVPGTSRSKAERPGDLRRRKTILTIKEHAELIRGIRTGQPLNEARQVAESTLMAIMGRESAYSGKMIEWDEALNSKQDLTPAKLEFGPMPTPPVAMPGKYRLT